MLIGNVREVLSQQILVGIILVGIILVGRLGALRIAFRDRGASLAHMRQLPSSQPVT